ncbi:MAG: hypothetical protein AAF726_22315 [Planctomycetota bacterium]
MKPPPTAVRFTPEDQKAAAAAFAGLPGGPPAEEAEEGQETPQDEPEADAADDVEDADDAQQSTTEDAEDVDFSDVLEELQTPSTRESNARENDAKTKLVELGWPEAVAHKMAFHGGIENAEKVIALAEGSAQSQVASPATQPAGSEETGVRLPDSVVEALGGPEAAELGRSINAHVASELGSMRSELATLKEVLFREESGKVRSALETARTGLMGEYPELRSKAEVDALKPAIRAAVASGVTDYAQAFRIAASSKYGVRAEGSAEATGADSRNDSVPKAGKAQKVGRKALTPEEVKRRTAEMIFNNRPEREVLDTAKRLNEQLER